MPLGWPTLKQVAATAVTAVASTVVATGVVVGAAAIVVVAAPVVIIGGVAGVGAGAVVAYVGLDGLRMKRWREPHPDDKKSETSEQRIKKRDRLRIKIARYRPEGVPVSRIVLIGFMAAGKSSFIRNIYSIILKQNWTIAAVGVNSKGSVTSKYAEYPIDMIDGKNKPLKFLLCDTRGMEPDSGGFNMEHLQDLLDGRIKDGFEFTPESFQRHARNNPELKVKPHVIVICIDCITVFTMTKTHVATLIKAKTIITRAGCNFVVLLTRIDKLCHQVDRDVKLVYKSIAIEEAVQKVSSLTGICASEILPVQNRVEGPHAPVDEEILALRAMRCILDSADHYIKSKTIKKATLSA